MSHKCINASLKISGGFVTS